MTLASAQQIFVVDDDEDDQFLICQVLEQHSPESTIRVLGDGEELLTALDKNEALPQLILLDVNMPRMGGLEALSHIRANQAYDRLPVVMLTTSDSEWDRQRAAELYADDYLVKPGTLEQMNRLIMQIKQHWL